MPVVLSVMTGLNQLKFFFRRKGKVLKWFSLNALTGIATLKLNDQITKKWFC
jgi:hypothetical protein